MGNRYLAETEEQLSQLGLEGLLTEDHHIELKRELGKGPSANKELARDLASFAIDGGAIYIGVAEGEPGTPTLHPVELTGSRTVSTKWRALRSVPRSPCIQDWCPRNVVPVGATSLFGSRRARTPLTWSMAATGDVAR